MKADPENTTFGRKGYSVRMGAERKVLGGEPAAIGKLQVFS